MAPERSTETRLSLLEQSDERRAKDIDEIKTSFSNDIADVRGAIARVQSSINKGVFAVCGLLFTTVVNLLIAISRVGK